jgi:hypothetical protein
LFRAGCETTPGLAEVVVGRAWCRRLRRVSTACVWPPRLRLPIEGAWLFDRGLDQLSFPRGGMAFDLASSPCVWVVSSAVNADVCRTLDVPMNEFWDLMEQARADAVECAAAFVIRGYISDDGFSDFKAGLAGLGRDTFERAVVDADALAELPLIQAAAAGQTERFVLAAEAIQHAASQAYERRTGDAEAFGDALDGLSVQDKGDAGEPLVGAVR